MQKMQNLVIAENGKAATTSLKIAEVFGKQHKNVIQSIERLECSPEFNRLNFQPVAYADAKGEKRPMYMITRDGFSFLAMGFTGEKAAKFKEAYIYAFNEMERQLAGNVRMLAEQITEAAWKKISSNTEKMIQLEYENRALRLFAPKCGLENLGKSGKNKIRRGAEVNGNGRPMSLVFKVSLQQELPLFEEDQTRRLDNAKNDRNAIR